MYLMFQMYNCFQHLTKKLKINYEPLSLSNAPVVSPAKVIVFFSQVLAYIYSVRFRNLSCYYQVSKSSAIYVPVFVDLTQNDKVKD
jgi:hypothetical protein